MTGSHNGRGNAPETTTLVFADHTVLRPLRRLIERLLDGYDEDTVYNAELVATELVTNAIEHAAGPRDLTLVLMSDRLSIHVTDASPTATLTPGRSRLGGHRGRGLELIDALSARSVTRGRTAKTVSATLPLT